VQVVRGAEGGDSAAQERLDAQIRKLEKWNRLSHSVRTEREALFQELRYLSESGSDEELFRRALEVVRLSCGSFSVFSDYCRPGCDGGDDESSQPAEARRGAAQQETLLELLLNKIVCAVVMEGVAAQPPLRCVEFRIPMPMTLDEYEIGRCRMSLCSLRFLLLFVAQLLELPAGGGAAGGGFCGQHGRVPDGARVL
jgi:hypothetical protein